MYISHFLHICHACTCRTAFTLGSRPTLTFDIRPPRARSFLGLTLGRTCFDTATGAAVAAALCDTRPPAAVQWIIRPTGRGDVGLVTGFDSLPQARRRRRHHHHRLHRSRRRRSLS
jgi:hypothetical protein